MKAGAAGIAAIALTAVSSQIPTQSPTAKAPVRAAQRLPLTPTCVDHDDTPPNDEGPFFTPNSPERASLLEPGIDGVFLTVTGFVYDETCVPLPGVLMDFWQCDKAGNYDNVGYILRGHQFTADDGSYALETIVPGHYTGRTLHIHLKVQAQNGPILTTQLFFPDNTQAYGLDVGYLNATDGLINRKCTVELGDLVDNHYPAAFDFVIRTARP